MIYRILADVVLCVHFAFILYVVFGGFFNIKWPWLTLIHLPAAIWGTLVELKGWYCPLTPLENMFRQKAGIEAIGTSFIEHLLTPIIYPNWLTREIQIVFGVFVIFVNVSVYALLVSFILRRRCPFDPRT